MNMYAIARAVVVTALRASKNKHGEEQMDAGKAVGQLQKREED